MANASSRNAQGALCEGGNTDAGWSTNLPCGTCSSTYVAMLTCDYELEEMSPHGMRESSFSD